MRLSLIVAALVISVPAASEAPAQSSHATDASRPASAAVPTDPRKIAKCRPTRAHFAHGESVWRDGPVRPKDLGELPPATGYMAVYRTVGGCEEPLTMVEYRNGARR